MEPSAAYRAFAEKCDRLLERTADPRHRQVLREMAPAWRDLADEKDRKKTALVRFVMVGFFSNDWVLVLVC